MGQLLKDAKLDSVSDDKKFVKLYDTYNAAVISDYDWDKEDIIEAINSYLNDPSRSGKLQRAAHMFADFDFSGGMISYFNKKDIDSDSELVRAFMIFAGAWVDVAIKATADPNYGKNYTYKGKWGETAIKNIVPIIQKVFFEYEEERLIFPEVEASLKQFSFVEFKKNLSNKINDWLSKDPEIDGLYHVKVYSRDGKRTYQWDDDEVYGLKVKIPDGLETKGLSFTTEQWQQLKEAGLLEDKANYINYSTGRINDITVDEDLENTSGSKVETTVFIFGTIESENAIRQAYSALALSLLRLHSEALRLGSVDNLSLENIRDKFNNDIEKAINKTNENYLSSSPATRGSIGYRAAQNILNSIRTNIFVQFLKKFNETGKALSEEEKNRAFEKAEEATRNNEEITGKETDAAELSEDDIKAKQKFLKQCLLMSRLKDMESINLNDMSNKSAGSVHESIPYKGRLYLVDEKDQNKDKSSIINKLLIPNISSIEPFVNITPSEHANLIPKIRLVKVYTEDGELKEYEFKFPKHTDSKRVNDLFSTDFDRGSDFGIKEFSFSFDGTSPATAKNDITATLKLYFQSFNDFIKDHPMNDGHRYVDLLILPSKSDGTPSPEKIGSGNTSPLQFDPSYYRIRADVGWESESAPDHIKPAIQKINKTFYLNMVDHEIDIRDDGSIEITVSYRAYIESALKGTTLDALASREARAALEKIRKQYQEVLNSSACTLEQLTTIRAQFLQIEENLRKNAFQSIIKRLVEYGLMKHVTVDSSAGETFRKTGFISAPAVFTGVPVGTGEPIKEKSNPADFTMNNNEFKDIRLTNNKSDLFINYFFLADLLYVILDCLYDPNDESKKENEAYIKGTENFKFLLSSFQYIDLFNNSNSESVNIGNIPISVELFNEWFTENVLKPERVSYPVMYFIRDISKYLVTEILLESCFKNDLNKTLQFKTNNFLGRRNKSEKRDPIGSLLMNQSNNVMLDVGQHYNDGDLPLEADLNGVSTSVKDLYNYITIYAESPRIKTDKVGNKLDDEMNGIMHYQLGRDRGILKKIKFSKSDMQYIREARFFRHGHDGLMQLSAVYKVSMDMIGNTLYYPGMEVFIDPVGLLGAGSDFDPRKQTSIANKMGFGGYHLVTSVKSSIGPGKFTTSVEALFSYSGDGDPRSRVIGSREEVPVEPIDTTKINEKPQGPNSKAYCEAIENKLYGQSAATGYGFQAGYEPIDTKPSAAVEQEVAQANEITEEGTTDG